MHQPAYLCCTVQNLVYQASRCCPPPQEGDLPLTGDHVREGLGCVVSVKVPDPEFEGQTKARLGNPEVRKIVDSVVSEVRGGERDLAGVGGDREGMRKGVQGVALQLRAQTRQV